MTWMLGGLAGPLMAQVKIGYANINAVLALMPETKAMNEELQKVEESLAGRVKVKQDYAQTKYQEYLEYVQNNETPEEAQVKQMEDELNGLQQEIQKARQAAQQQLANVRADKMEPIIEKIQATIKRIADAEGYTYILNTTDGSGVSIILHAPEEHDLTEKILNDLGIEIPEELKASN